MPGSRQFVLGVDLDGVVADFAQGLKPIAAEWLGVGAARRVSAVRWNVASSIVYAWVITIPASAIVAALTYWAVLLLR